MSVSDFAYFWQFGKDEDASNWFVLTFSLVLWPILISSFLLWYNRKVQSIRGLEVLPTQAQTKINGQAFDAVGLTFKNQTGSVVYLYRARLRENPKNFPIPLIAVKDISGGWRSLKFQAPNSIEFIDDERVLHTNKSASTLMAVSKCMDSTFYDYQPGWFRRWLRKPKYFRLEYTAMIGEKKYSVAMV
jgi:hypothetical protein